MPTTALLWSLTGVRRAPRFRSINSFGTIDRKSTRLNSSHANISYAVFCLKKKMHGVSVHNLRHRMLVSVNVRGGHVALLPDKVDPLGSAASRQPLNLAD